MKNIGIQVVVAVLFAASISHGAEVYFTPSAQCEERIVQNIDQAKKTIVVAVYSINNKKIMKALGRVKNRGVDIKVLTDSLQAAGKSSGVLEMLKTGLNLRVHSVHKIMHNKFAVFDNKSAVSGSYNWTGAATFTNSENCVFFDEANVLTSFTAEFNSLWEKNTQQKSDVKITKLKMRAARVPARE